MDSCRRARKKDSVLFKDSSTKVRVEACRRFLLVHGTSTQNANDHNSRKMESIPKEPHPWRNSKAQRLLQDLMMSGELRCDEGARLAPLEVWNTYCRPRQEFSGFLYSKFPARLRAMQKRHVTNGGRAAEEAALLAHHKQHFPVSTHNHRGEPRWNGSDAERLLKLDVSAKEHELMCPQLLHGTRVEYQAYPLEVFRKHIHQEVRSQKLKQQYHPHNRSK